MGWVHCLKYIHEVIVKPWVMFGWVHSQEGNIAIEFKWLFIPVFKNINLWWKWIYESTILTYQCIVGSMKMHSCKVGHRFEIQNLELLAESIPKLRSIKSRIEVIIANFFFWYVSKLVSLESTICWIRVSISSIDKSIHRYF